MNDKDIQTKIEELQKEVTELRNSFASSFRTCAIIYILLIVFVAGYTSYIYSQIKDLATPEAFARLMVDSVKSKLPGFRSSVRGQMAPFAEDLAERSVNGVQTLIPDAGQYLRNTLNTATDELLAKFEKEHFPAVEKAVDETIASVLQDKDKVKNKDIGEALADKINEDVNKEIDKFVNPEFYSTLANLQGELDNLRQLPYRKMTRKQYSELSFIICWIRLNELYNAEDKDSSVLSSVVNFSDQAAKKLSGAIDTKKAVKKK